MKARKIKNKFGVQKALRQESVKLTIYFYTDYLMPRSYAEQIYGTIYKHKEIFLKQFIGRIQTLSGQNIVASRTKYLNLAATARAIKSLILC